MPRPRQLLQNSRYIPRIVLLVWSATKQWLIAWIILLLLQSILPILIVVLTRNSVNSVVSLVKDGWDVQKIESALIPIVLLVLCMTATNISGSIASWVRVGQSELIRDHVSSLIQAQAVRLDLSFYDQKDFYDLLHRVQQQARDQPLTFLESVGLVIKNVLTLLGMSALLFSYSPWLMPLLIVGALPALWAVIRFSGLLNQWRVESTSRERRAYYYDYLLSERMAAAEVRLFSLGNYYQSLYTTLRSALRSERLRLWRKKAAIDLFVTISGIGTVGLVMLWMGWQVLIGLATIGDLAALYQIFSQVQDILGATVGQIGSLYQSVLFIADLFDFLDIEPKLVDTADGEVKPIAQEIRFEHVTFRYPGSERDALKDFSMTIPAGKITALVGANGEGKTTLMKLLCRFYDVSDGRITWDGVELSTLPAEKLRRQISMLFQTPFPYPETAFFNIALGDLDSELSSDDIIKAAQFAGAHDFIERLPQKYETTLGKWFGGEELSVGQWQRVALARAFARRGSLIILDEPTSAMDAWAEMDWLHRLREANSDQTMIMITHRFTTAMQADCIYVLRDQRIIEHGTHAELLALNGYYASSWHEQMRRSESDSYESME